MENRITIYDKVNQELLQAPITRECVRKRVLMGDNYILLVFNHDSYIDFRKGSHIIYKGFKYEIMKDVYPERNRGGWKCSLQFDAKDGLLRKYNIFYRKQDLEEVVFALTTDLLSFGNVICDCINHELGGTNWRVKSIPEEFADKIKTISFKGEKLFDALTMIVEQFECEWWIEENGELVDICFGKLLFGTEEEFEEGKAVKSISRKAGDSSDFGTRFFCYGSARNLTPEYGQVEQGGTTNHISEIRLRLPDGINYIDAWNNLAPEDVVQQIAFFDDIYPKNTDIITKVETVKRPIEGSIETFDAYIITAANTPFVPSDIIKGETLGCVFETGALQGQSFELKINYDPEKWKPSDGFDKKFEIIHVKNGDIIVPNKSFKPEVGDKFVVTGVKLPEVRIREAEQELLKAGKAWAEKKSRDTSLCDCPTNPVFCQENNKNYDLGQKVKLIDNARFGVSGRSSRIQGYEKKLWNEYEATYTVGDNPQYSRLNKIEGDIKESQYSERIGVVKGAGIYLIRNNFDNTQPTNYNAYSALASLKKFVTYAGYVDQPVRTTDDVQFRDILGCIITLTEGLMTDNFVAGMSGVGVGIVNKAEVHADKVLVRKYLEVLALVVQKMYWRGGMQVLSPAGMKISRLEELNDYWRCYMETEDGQTNDFTIGAQARCNTFGDVQKYYWRLVVGIGMDYIDLSKTDCDTGSADPQIGDDVVQVGHRTDPNLQWVVIDSCFSTDAGRTIYAGVNGYSLEGKLVLREGVSPTDPSRIGLFTKYGEFSDVIDGMNQTIQEAIAKTVQVTAPGQVFKYGPGYTGTPTPAGIVLTATPRNFTPTSYQWQYLNGSTWTNISGATGATYSVAPGNTTLFPSGTNVRTFRCICNGDEKLSDSFTIAKLADGATGATGSAGADAYTVLLTNEAHAFVGSASAALAGSTPCQIIAYKGATQVAVTIGSITGLPTGMTASTSNNGTTSATVTFAVTTGMNTANGTVSIPLTVDGKSFTRVFSYSIAFRGATGATGAKGETGPTGSQGIPGTSQYFHVKYSANSNGNPMSDTPNTYIGTVVTSSATAPTGYTSYKWVQLKGSQGAQGTQGIPGVNGTNGKTTYLHIKYSDNGTSFTANNGETPGAYIGQYTDFTAADSMTFSAYTWTKVKGETGSTGAPGAQGIPGESITGKMLFKDPMFAKGINGVSVYSNAAADVRAKLTVERVYRPSDAPTKGSYCLRITCKAPQSPDYGGVVQSLFSRANAVFIQKIIANIPVGYAIRSATNSMGSGYKDVWLTSCAGTGKYETYLRKVTCGASGTFSSGGHVYISGSPVPTESAPLIWHIAYMTAFDMTDDGYADIEYDAKNDLAQQLGFTDYAALEANALTRGPLINAGLINAVLINTVALAADTAFISNIKTKVLTAGSITAGMLASNFVFTKQIQIGPNASTINFKVDSNGVMTAKGADISGNINATTGSFGNIQISGSEFVSKNGAIVFKKGNDKVSMFSGTSRLSINIWDKTADTCLDLYNQSSDSRSSCLKVHRQMLAGVAIDSTGSCVFNVRNGETFKVTLNNQNINAIEVNRDAVYIRKYCYLPNLPSHSSFSNSYWPVWWHSGLKVLVYGHW